MVCKKCKRECLESELKDGVCIECTSKKKNNTIRIIIISVVISAILNLGITIWFNNDAKVSDFKIEYFNMETEKTTYTYSEDSLSYSGKGKISCKDTNTDYTVLVEKKNKVNGETECFPVIIHEGEGEISTYDSSYSGTTQKPEYEFKIIGYRSFKK